MSAIAALRHRLRGYTSRIGPGRLVLVVGPSGAGKDTVITLARQRCEGDPDILFPRRVVTRAASAFEDHDTLTPEAFEQQLAEGAFALHWRAHGLSYALPRAMDDDLRAGRTVVFNVSRTVIEATREHYAGVAVVLITAPPEMLAARLAGRDRASDGSVADRLARNAIVARQLSPDVTIDNVGPPEFAAKTLVDVIYDRIPVIAI